MMTERLLPAISACLDWAQTVEEPPTLHIEALVLLLSAHQDVGATDPGDWTVDDVHEVAALVRHRDRLPELFRETWLSWCDHLVTDARLISTETPRRLRAAIENVDLTRPDHAPPDCEAPPEIAVPLLERLGYGETQTPEPPRPHLPTPVADLDIRAGACPTLNLAARLSAWMDPQVLLRPYTEHDALGENDTAEAARALDVRSDEIPFLFTVARAAGLVRTDYLHARPGPAAHAWVEETPGAVADAWADALSTMTARPGATPFLVLGELFLTGRALSLDDLVHVCAEPNPKSCLPRVLEVLTELGAVVPTGDGRYLITGLGDHCVARRLRACGVEVPGTPPAPGLSPTELLELAATARPIDIEPLLDQWLAGREPSEAARGLLAAGLAPEDPEDFFRRVTEHPRGGTVLECAGQDSLLADAVRRVDSSQSCDPSPSPFARAGVDRFEDESCFDFADEEASSHGADDGYGFPFETEDQPYMESSPHWESESSH